MNPKFESTEFLIGEYVICSSLSIEDLKNKNGRYLSCIIFKIGYMQYLESEIKSSYKPPFPVFISMSDGLVGQKFESREDLISYLNENDCRFATTEEIVKVIISQRKPFEKKDIFNIHWE